MSDYLDGHCVYFLIMAVNKHCVSF